MTIGILAEHTYNNVEETELGRQFDVVIERDEDGFYVASVPQVPGCHTQAQSLDALMERIREAIVVCLEGKAPSARASVYWRSARVTIAALARRPPSLVRKLLAALSVAGSSVSRIRGSHHFLKHQNGRCTVVPVHAGEMIGTGLLLTILRDCDLTLDQFEKLL